MKKIIISILALVILSSSALVGQTPDTKFGVKAYYVDNRTQVVKMEALYELVDDLATKDINAIVFEYEATFPFIKHATLCNEFSYSEKELTEFIAYAAEKGIEIIPLQNCFGHAEYILRHNRYYGLREHKKEVSMICPLKHDKATPIFEEIFAEVARLHPSQYIHIGADETYLLGSCPECQEVVKTEGKSRLFVDYVNAMVKIVKDMGKTPIIWADIILKYPESVKELDKDLIFVDWNYGWDVNRFGDLQHLFDAGVKMWGASALRSGPDNLYLTQWKKHFENLRDFLPHARKNGYEGLINTSWSTSGTYGYHYDSYQEVLSMQPIRQVYPAVAFNILLEAYSQAVNFEEALDYEKFILEYAAERFGADSTQSQVLLDYMLLPQETIGRNGKDKKGVLISKVIEESAEVYKGLKNFEPTKNQAEYEHLVLMLEIRLNYLQYKEIEAMYDTKKFAGKRVTQNVGMMAERMEDIVADADRLRVRFIELNKDYLKDGQWHQVFDTHTEKMRELARRLKAYTEIL